MKLFFGLVFCLMSWVFTASGVILAIIGWTLLIIGPFILGFILGIAVEMSYQMNK